MWVFNGLKNKFPSALFETSMEARLWIRKNKLSGVLTEYPVGISAYDWAIKNGLFEPKSEKHLSAEFIENYSTASQEHFHFENGEEPYIGENAS